MKTIKTLIQFVLMIITFIGMIYIVLMIVDSWLGH
jgi:hypothetical protein